jgi:hypothetical protein
MYVSQSTTTGRSSVLYLLLMLILGAAVVALGYVVGNVSLSEPEVGRRWIAFGIGALIVFVIYLLTAKSPIWRFTPRQLVFAAIGLIIYGVLIYIANTSSIFAISAASQVSLRPAIVVPVLAGFFFGPAAGFLTGLGGNVVGDVLPGFGVYPQWDMGNGLIGLIAGLAFLVPPERRLRASLYALGAAAIIAVITSIMFIGNQTTPNQFIFSDTPTAVSAILGMTPIFGVALMVGAYLFLAMIYPDAAVAVVWGGLGNLLGIGFAALADIYVNQYSLPTAVVGEFIPVAGPNLLVLTILVPLLMVLYRSAQRQRAPQVRKA